jgi:glycosyltransferase involved in cell wall biosynthesis
MNTFFSKSKETISNTRISFIIAVKDNFKYTKDIYHNLRKTHPKEEIVIVSGDSEDETNEYFSKIKNQNLKFISLTNTNLSNNYNVGVKSSTNDIVVLVHNDMYIPTSFKNSFLKCLHKGCITTYTRVEPPIFSNPERGKEIQNFGDTPENFNKEKFEEFSENYNKVSIGGDKIFFGCYKQDYLDLDSDTFQMFCEDDDLHLRFTLSGKHKAISNACVYHFVSKTSRKGDTSLIEQQSNTNFIKKWGFRYSRYKVVYKKSYKLINPNPQLEQALEPWFNGGEDIIVEIDGTNFTQQDFQLIQQLNDIVKESGEIGEFTLGNLKITINSLKEYQNDLIKLP